ncbi:unnamed protein product [Prunus armeniaca]
MGSTGETQMTLTQVSDGEPNLFSMQLASASVLLMDATTSVNPSLRLDEEGNKVEDCKEMVKKVDWDGDGILDFDEFKRMMKFSYSTREEEEEEEEEVHNSHGALHKYNFFLLAMLGALLQLKHAAANIASPFVTNYVTLLIFIVDLFVYVASLVTVEMLENNPDLAEFMNNVSLLSGVLASALLLLILIPALGWLTLLLWITYFVKDVVTVRSYISVALHVFDRVKELMNIQEQNNCDEQEIRMEEGQNGPPR